MKVLSNLFGLNKKISASDIAIKDNNGKAKTKGMLGVIMIRKCQ